MDQGAGRPASVTAPWYRHKAVRVVGVVLAVLSVLMTIAIAVAFVQWNGRPEKALFDAIDYSLKQPGSYAVSAEGFTASIQVKDRQFAADATVESIPVHLIGNADVLYVKTPQPEQLLEKIVPESSLSQLRPLIGGIVATAKERWLKVNLKDKSLNFAAFDQLACAAAVKNILAFDDTTRRGVAGAYMANPFLVIDSVDKQEKHETYSMTVDAAKRAEFRKALAKTEASETMPDCIESPMNLLEQLDVKSLRVEVAKPVHRFVSVTLEMPRGGIATMTADYAKKPEIAIPKESVELNQVMSSVFTNMLQTYFKGR